MYTLSLGSVPLGRMTTREPPASHSRRMSFGGNGPKPFRKSSTDSTGCPPSSVGSAERMRAMIRGTSARSSKRAETCDEAKAPIRPSSSRSRSATLRPAAFSSSTIARKSTAADRPSLSRTVPGFTR